MKVLLALFIYSFTHFSYAESFCAPVMSLGDFTTLLEKTRERYFPELSNETLVIKTFKSDAYFLEARPAMKTILGKRSRRIYNIKLNLKLLECPPAEEALEAILVHELEHIKDYSQWSLSKIAKLGVRYTTSLKFRARYERATDRKVLDKGLSLGLAGYRTWVYQWLSPRQLKRKRYIYITPEEILGESSEFH